MRITQHEYPTCVKGLGKRLREARQEKGLSQSKLANLVECHSQALISWWESERTYPSTGYIIQICKALNISADYLLGLSDKKKSATNAGTFKGADEKTSYRNHI